MRGADGDAPGRRPAAGRGHARILGGGPGPEPDWCGRPGEPRVRVRPAGLYLGLAGSVTSRARQLQQAVMLVAGRGVIVAEFFDAGQSRMLPWARRPQAAALVAAAGGPGPRVGRDRDRGVRAGVLREPVRVDVAVVRALRDRPVDAGGRRAGRLARRGSRADHARAGPVVQAGDHPDPDPGADRDGRPDPGTGTLSRRPPAVRIPARRRGAAPEQGPRRLGPAGAPARTRSGDRACRQVECSPSGWPGTAPRGSPGR